jgi:hypothetical protein
MPVPRTTGLETAPEAVELYVRIVLTAIAVLAVHDLRLVGMKSESILQESLS